MNPICQLCNKETKLDNETGVRAQHDSYQLFYCHLCQTKSGHDSMYKELYHKGTLICSNMIIDDFYIMWHRELSHRTIIFKNITGTVAHSIHLWPITAHEPIVALPFLLELPMHDLMATLKKLQTYVIFS